MRLSEQDLVVAAVVVGSERGSVKWGAVMESVLVVMECWSEVVLAEVVFVWA